MLLVVFFFKQKTAYEMRISDWSSDVCSSDLRMAGGTHGRVEATPSRTQIMMREPCAQTVVCAASRPAQQKQHATRRTKLLPNDMQKQQTNAASAKLLG